jgi:DNA-binding CsgD family transcriptional regulator
VTESTLPNEDLALLTSALDCPGTDLQETLGVLADHLAAALPSYAGLTMRVVVDGVAVTLTAGDRHLAVTTSAHRNPRHCTPAQNDPDGMVIFSAAQAGGLADLAAVVTRSADGDRSIAQAHTAHSLGVSGLAEFSARNQAIGALVEQGHTPAEARIEIQRRATRTSRTLNETAQDILDTLTRSVSTRIDRFGVTGLIAEGKRNPTLNRTVMHVQADANKTHVVRMRQPTSRARTGSTRGAGLTTPERAVLGLLVAGSSTATIAMALRLVPGTVRNHTHAIMAKLGAHSRVETVAISLNKNILGTP